MNVPDLPRLPYDLCERVLHHLCAMRIQCAWLRWTHFSHARRDRWASVRAALGPRAWRRLIPYEQVRREWRQESHSWLSACRGTLELICEETCEGYWGTRAHRLVVDAPV